MLGQGKKPNSTYLNFYKLQFKICDEDKLKINYNKLQSLRYNKLLLNYDNE